MRTRHTGRRVATVAFVAVIAAVAAVSPAQADTATGNLGVTATVTGAPPPTGSISTTPVAFGAYVNPNGGVVLGTGTVIVTVSVGAPYTVDLGAGAGGTGSQRKMFPTGQTVSPLSYNLYKDSGRTQVWGSASGGTTVAGTGTAMATPLTVYGQINAQQTLTVLGAYSDTVVATVQF